MPVGLHAHTRTRHVSPPNTHASHMSQTALQLLCRHPPHGHAQAPHIPLSSPPPLTPTPPHTLQELPCGHLMHSSCFAAYTRYNYTCPLCSRSIGDMSVYFQVRERGKGAREGKGGERRERE
eukprot:308349-Chlamydomonas_euryale.AAC.1